MTPAEILRNAAAEILKPGQWCQRAMEQKRPLNGDLITARCASGWLTYLSCGDDSAHEALYAEICGCITLWNDAADATPEKVAATMIVLPG